MHRILVIGLVLILAILPPAFGQATFKRGTLTLTQGSRRVVLQVEVADTPAARARGLMFRDQLPELAGMLFIFESESHWAFWMKNTLIPLTIGFFDAKWRLVDIKDMKVAPDPEKGPFALYQTEAPAMYALEVNLCFFKRHSLRQWVWRDAQLVSPGATAVLALTQGSAVPRTTPQTSTTAAALPTCVGK
ncbi:MAG TPA: DUF192 domain-containing protein [bacterium]|jgi:hypothetical protein|nr:DUF192 domain-containing protein [bacterium]